MTRELSTEPEPTTARARDAAAVYLEPILAFAPEVLSMLDREAFSRTSGCMDRTFWAWKFVDFPGARFQEGLCALSFLWATAAPNNPYAGNARLLSWIAQGFDYWARIQRPTGDYDEAYPYERSLAATAFTSFYVAEAFGFVGDALPAATRDRFLHAHRRAAEWLCVNDETHGFLSNHLAAAGAALAHAYRLTGEQRFEARAKHFVDKILAHQSDEGWYDEYGAADPGYQTHGSFYLARIDELTDGVLCGQDVGLAESLDRSFRFLAHFVHPDRSLGGEYTSRNTQTYYPAAFELMKAKSGAASWIATTMLPAVEDCSAAGLRTVDIYNLFPLLNNHVFAYLGAVRNADDALPPDGPDESPGTIHFPAAGLLKVRRAHYDAFVGLAKGGVFKLFDRRSARLVASSCGWIGRLRSGGVVSNQTLDPDRPVALDGDRVVVGGRFFAVSRPVMDPTRFLAFRVFSLTVGRLKRVAYWLKALLVKTLIYKKRELELSFERTLVFGDDVVTVEDRISGDGSALESLEHGSAFTTIHMGSSRYFVPHELEPDPQADAAFHAPVQPLELGSGGAAQRRLEIRLDADAPVPDTEA